MNPDQPEPSENREPPQAPASFPEKFPEARPHWPFGDSPVGNGCACLVAGFFLSLLAVGASILLRSPALFVLIAFGSLFFLAFEGYRLIFAGFAGTIVLAVLLVIVSCNGVGRIAP